MTSPRRSPSTPSNSRQRLRRRPATAVTVKRWIWKLARFRRRVRPCLWISTRLCQPLLASSQSMGWKTVSKRTTGEYYGFGIPKNIFLFFKSLNSKETKAPSPIIMTSTVPSCMTQSHVTSTTSSIKMDSNEPPTKLIKLINGSAILAPMDKDNKMIHSGQLTLQQVMVIKRHATWRSV